VAVGVVALVLGALLVAGRPDDGGPPLSPDGTGPLGTKALVLLLEELGAEVDVTPSAPTEAHDVALVLADDLDDAGRAAVGAWLEAGGTLVVADPSSPLAPPAREATTAPALERGCDVPALAGVARVAPSGGALLVAGEGATSCFDGFVVVGDGLVAVGGAGAFVNGVLGDEDNAALAAALLAPAPGTRVAILQPPLPGGGTRSLADLVGDGVRSLLWQLAIAFVIFALWRARRLGGVVAERQPVELPASELVVAVGNLLQQARHQEAAGNLLRDDLRRALAERLGLGPAASPEQVAEVASTRTGIPAARLLHVLRPSPLAGADDLVGLAVEAEALRREVTHV
jgi:hypothetical protein